MKILLLGKNGQLGRAFEKELRHTGHDWQSCGRTDLDITQLEQVRGLTERIRPEVVINCAAYTDVKEAEQSPQPAYAVNADAIQHLVTACEPLQTKIIHFSTDYVFDGSKHSPYNEDDPTNPLNEYGRSKRHGELALSAATSPWLLLRTSWVYGDGTSNFVFRFQQWAAKNATLRIVDDERSVPTCAEDIARLTLAAVEANMTGLYHLVNSGNASRYEFARAIQKAIPDIRSEIVPTRLAEFPSSVQRPGYSVLDPSQFANVLGTNIPHWEESLERFLKARPQTTG